MVDLSFFAKAYGMVLHFLSASSTLTCLKHALLYGYVEWSFSEIQLSIFAFSLHTPKSSVCVPSFAVEVSPSLLRAAADSLMHPTRIVLLHG